MLPVVIEGTFTLQPEEPTNNAAESGSALPAASQAPLPMPQAPPRALHPEQSAPDATSRSLFHADPASPAVTTWQQSPVAAAPGANTYLHHEPSFDLNGGIVQPLVPGPGLSQNGTTATTLPRPLILPQAERERRHHGRAHHGRACVACVSLQLQP